MDYRPCGDLGSLYGKNSRGDSVTKARVMVRRRVGAGQRNVRRRGLLPARPGSAQRSLCVRWRRRHPLDPVRMRWWSFRRRAVCRQGVTEDWRWSIMDLYSGRRAE
ncbi:hypothetical protein IG631_06037 [Alternaria alternata]|jgi:hypothetical protein|nr:hypothetical protein IG631_06037 [Alternaria alternata]